MNAIEPDSNELFNRLADGLSTAEDEQQLAAVLRESADARRAYREFMALHSALHWDYVAAVSPETPPAPIPPVALPIQPTSATSKLKLRVEDRPHRPALLGKPAVAPEN